MKDLIVKYIKDSVSELKYKGDTVDLEGVYPSILEEVLGNFDKPYSLNGYDCDYGTTIGDYEISGCMRFGTANITLTKGDIKPTLQKENYKDKESSKSVKSPKYRTVAVECLSEEEVKELNTYYFTFGIGQKYEGMYQSIMAKNISIALDKMLEMYGTKWSSNYNQEEWNEVWEEWGVLYEGKSLETIAVLDV